MIVNKKKLKILFVCAGNICRSPLAQSVFEERARRLGVGDSFVVDSAGTTAYHAGQGPDERMRGVARQKGVEIVHRARQFHDRDLQDFDLILAMDRENLRDLKAAARTDEERKKLRLYREFDPESDENANVPDPYYGGEAGFEGVFEIVDRTSRSLIGVLTAGGGPLEGFPEPSLNGKSHFEPPVD